MIRILSFAAASLLALTTYASTGFHIGDYATRHLPSIYGISTGWYYDVRAVMTANPRNVAKTAETFGAPIPALTWVSKYGSVSQTMYGLEFPMSGMNERGLIIQATVFKDRKYPNVPNGGFGLHPTQWIQYQLDTAASVTEVIHSSVTLNAPKIPQGSTNIQYQVCDLEKCAVIAFSEQGAIAQGLIGEIEVDYARQTYRNDSSRYSAIAAIANNSYTESMAAYSACRQFPCTTPDDSLNRFIKAAEMIRHFVQVPATNNLGLLLTDVMSQLKAVDQGIPLTTWNEAYAFIPTGPGHAQMIMAYKTPSLPANAYQWIDFSGMSFDCREPVKMWRMQMDRAGGNQTATAIPHTHAEQEALIRQQSGTVPAQAMPFFINYPFSKTKCLGQTRH